MFTKPYDEEKFGDIPPIDKNGKPTTYLSFMILKVMFSEPNRWFTPEDLAKLLAANRSDTDSICHQLTVTDLLTSDSSQPGRYKYNINSNNIDIQTEFESFMADVELDNLPVHLMLDYSPSYRSPTHLRSSRL